MSGPSVVEILRCFYEAHRSGYDRMCPEVYAIARERGVTHPMHLAQLEELLGAVDAGRPVDTWAPTKTLRAQVASARRAFVKDGVGGETVHALCDAAERLIALQECSTVFREDRS